MPSPTANDAQGAVSTGSMSNPIFGEPAMIGDIAWVEITPPSGYIHADYTIPAIQNVGMSLSQAGPFTVNTPLSLGAFESTRRIYLQAMVACSPAPKMVLPTTGFVLDSGNSARGGVAALSSVVGSFFHVETAQGLVQTPSGVFGSVEIFGVLEASGLASAASGVYGSAIDAHPAAGVVASSSSLIGDATIASYISGTLVATPASGQVTLSGPTSNVSPTRWERKTDSGSWVQIASTSTTFPSTVVSGLTNGQSYLFTVRAVYGTTNSNELTVTQTAGSTPLVYDFNEVAGTTANNTHWFTDLAGAGSTCATDGLGNMKMHVTAGSSQSGLVYRPIVTGTNTYEWIISMTSNSGGGSNQATIFEMFETTDPFNSWAGYHSLFLIQHDVMNNRNYMLRKSQGTDTWEYLFTDGSGQVAASSDTRVYFTDALTAWHTLVVDTTATTIRVRLMNSDKTITYADSGVQTFGSNIRYNGNSKFVRSMVYIAAGPYGDMFIDKFTHS